ncbi:HAD hydrolase-like protein [Candidatus Pelagibacter sp. Uisw_104]|uniref:HAD hydrolase-like protein n=1 Tax=Candidatus Pelagibacter sp. Uisw_104 TaxID=3230983 RepID=UPI0039ECE2E3
MKPKKNVLDIFKYLHKDYKIGIATNAVKSTLEICLKNLGISKYVDFKLFK